MKKLLILIAAVCTLAACTTKNPSNSTRNDPSEWKHFSCEWFDFDYPPYFEVDEERNDISDTIPALKSGGEVTLYGAYLPYRLRFVKSAMFDVFDRPEAWRDFSIQTKGFEQSNEGVTYLGVLETRDSLTFKGNPAASVVFSVLDGTDTVAHYQLVVMTQPSNSLYYLNYMAPVSIYDKYFATADSIMNTLKFK